MKINLKNINSDKINHLKQAFDNSGSIIWKSMKLDDFPRVMNFIRKYTEDEFFNYIDVYVMKGTLLKDGSEAYSLFFDGDDEELNSETTVMIGNTEYEVSVVPDSPIILISRGVYDNDVLLETTLVHEVCHYIDGAPRGEEVAKRFEYNYLTSVYRMQKEEAEKVLHNKYCKE